MSQALALVRGDVPARAGQEQEKEWQGTLHGRAFQPPVVFPAGRGRIQSGGRLLQLGFRF
jgi:hypothetical protein